MLLSFLEQFNAVHVKHVLKSSLYEFLRVLYRLCGCAVVFVTFKIARA